MEHIKEDIIEIYVLKKELLKEKLKDIEIHISKCKSCRNLVNEYQALYNIEKSSASIKKVERILKNREDKVYDPTTIFPVRKRSFFEFIQNIKKVFLDLISFNLSWRNWQLGYSLAMIILFSIIIIYFVFIRGTRNNNINLVNIVDSTNVPQKEEELFSNNTEPTEKEEVFNSKDREKKSSIIIKESHKKNDYNLSYKIFSGDYSNLQYLAYFDSSKNALTILTFNVDERFPKISKDNVSQIIHSEKINNVIHFSPDLDSVKFLSFKKILNISEINENLLSITVEYEIKDTTLISNKIKYNFSSEFELLNIEYPSDLKDYFYKTKDKNNIKESSIEEYLKNYIEVNRNLNKKLEIDTLNNEK